MIISSLNWVKCPNTLIAGAAKVSAPLPNIIDLK